MSRPAAVGEASLRARVTGTGLVVVVVTLVLANAAVYFPLAGALRGDLEERLADRARLATGLAEELPLTAIFDRLERAGIPARVVRSGEADVRTTALVLRSGERMLQRDVAVPGTGRLIVAVSAADVDRSLRNLVTLQALGTAFGACLATLFLLRTSRRALAPLDRVVEMAQRIARGRTGERMRPRRADTEIGRLAAAFDEMLDAEEAALEKARQSSILNQQFLADAAHQLRTPLSGIRASAELLIMDPGRAERSRLLANLVQSAERAGLLVDALLRMARIDQGPPPEGARTDLLSLCQKEADRFRLQSHAVEIGVTSDLESCPAVLDAPAMREAIGNLLDNACRHAVSRVDVRVAVAEGTATVRVGDDGPGMEADVAARAFERFATFDAGQGAGLGLPIARGIVEAHGGTLEYADGAFEVRLPTRI